MLVFEISKTKLTITLRELRFEIFSFVYYLCTQFVLVVAHLALDGDVSVASVSLSVYNMIPEYHI